MQRLSFSIVRRRLTQTRAIGSSSKRCFSSSVYSWGSGDNGQLGHPAIEKDLLTQRYVETSPRKIEQLEHQDVVDASCGFTHTAVITSDGRVLTFGEDKGYLLGHDGDGDGTKQCVTARIAEGDLADVRAKAVVCGENHTGVLSADGDCYTWGWGGSMWGGCGGLGTGNKEDVTRPKKILIDGGNDVKFQQIATGRKHMLGLDNDGIVWSWGCGENGRLGNGSSSDQLEPYPVEYFLELDLKIKMIACGNSFSLALTDDGQVYGWGKNDQSQLGLGGGIAMDVYAMEEMPTHVEALEKENIVYIAAGGSQTMAINAKGQTFTWGMRLWMEPHLMSAISDEFPIVQGDCGNGFFAVVSSAGTMWTWGKGLFARQAGVLAHGDTKRHAQPELVQSMQDIPVKKVVCGNRHACAFTSI